MSEVVFEVEQEDDGGYCARAVGESISTQGETWEELREMVLDATTGHFFDSEPPESIAVDLMRDQILRFAQ